MILLDTDVLIWILRGEEKVRSQFKRAVEETKGNLFITTVQITEIFAGMKKKEEEYTRAFLNSFGLVLIDREIAELAGEFMRIYRKSHSVEFADATVAAAAKVKGFKLWTYNKKHYPMFDEQEFYS